MNSKTKQLKYIKGVFEVTLPLDNYFTLSQLLTLQRLSGFR